MPSSFEKVDPELQPTPVLLADAHKDVIPHTYVVIEYTTCCLGCSHVFKTCETYAKTHLRSQWGHKYVTNLRPLEKARYRLPMEVYKKQRQDIPFCTECPDPNSILSQLPFPPADQPKTIAPSWIKDKVLETKPKEAKPPKTSSTDDLLKGIDL